MHRSFYQETWPEQMFDGEEWFKLSTPPSFGFGDLINDDDQPNIGCFIIDQGSRPGAGASRQSMVIQLTAEIEYFTRSCIIIRTERVEIWRRQLTQFIIVPGWSLTQLSSSRPFHYVQVQSPQSELISNPFWYHLHPSCTRRFHHIDCESCSFLSSFESRAKFAL